MATVAEAEQSQTLEKVDVVTIERPKDQYETRDIGSLEDKNSRAGRLTRSSDSPSSIENAGEDEKTWMTQKSPPGKDTIKDAESWTSMASEPVSYTQNQDYSDTETQVDVAEEAPKVAYPSRERQSGNVADQGGDSRFNIPMGSYPYSQYAVKENRSEIQIDVESPRQSQEKSHGAPERKSYDDATRQYSSRTREQPDSSSGIIILSKPEGTRWRPRTVYSPVEKALGIKYVSRQLAKLEALRAKNDIASIKLEMELMAIIIEENKENNGPGALPDKWVMQLQDLVHDIEDFIDVYNWLRVRSWRGTHAHMSRIVHLKNRTKIVRKWQRNAISSKNEGIAAASGPSAGSTFDYWPQGNFIGMDSLRNELLHLVTNYYDDSHQAPVVISIVGPPGVGKTALARSVYDDYNKSFKFECLAWVLASECSSTGDLVSKICQQLHREPRETLLNIHLLQKIVRHKRCLVIIDDLQQAGLFNDIQYALTTAEPGSRIIVTTSIQSIAAACSRSERYIYKMRVLSYGESKELFLRKIGREVDRTPAGEHALNEILIKCGGLPLALVSVAYYLRGQGENLIYGMTKIVKSLADAPVVFEAMNTAFMKSYNNLPDSVHRSCLLSLSIFPQGHLIKRKSLIRRWIAEGWVVGGSLGAEQLANVCFDDLIDRNIIEPVSIGINSKVKTVRVQEFLLEVIVNKSVCKNFAALVRMDEPLHRSSCPVRRLSVHGGTPKSISRIAKAIGLNHVRSLTICRSVPLDLRTCRLLRVLDMEGCVQINDSVFSAICGLVLLKYLSLRRTNVRRIPAPIRNLCDLETLDIRETQVGMLPMEVLMLPRLAYLFGQFHLPQELRDEKKRRKVKRFFEEESRLQAVSGFVMVEYNGYEPIVLHMRFLRKIKIWCQGFISRDSRHLLVSCLKERFLPQGESLSIDFGYTDVGRYFAANTESSGPCRLSSIKLRGKLGSVPGFIISPHAKNLSELHLSSTGLSLEDLSVLQQLPRLLYLKLAEDSDGFRGDRFVVEWKGFPSLERLCFQAPKLPLVLICRGAMRSLKSLHLLCPLLDTWEYTQFWEIEHLENLNEVVLRDSASLDELIFWEDRAREHANMPKVTVQQLP
ncbi:unnamed protein product [Urochloa humidicola]